MRPVEDVGGVATAVALRAVWGLRAGGILAGAILARRGDQDTALLDLVTVAALVLYVPAALLRFRRGLMTPIAAVDIALVSGAMAASGGLDSPVRLLLVPLPLVAALLLSPRGVLLHGLTLGLGQLTVGVLAGGRAVGPAVALLFAALAAGLLATLREGLLRGLDQALRRRRDAERHERAASLEEREQVAGELERSAIAPLRAAVAGASSAELAGALRAVSAAIRTVVAELHALSARPIVLPNALAQLGASFAERTGVPVAVEHRGLSTGGAAVDELVLAVARPVLREAVAIPGAEAVLLCVDRDDGGASVRLRVTGPTALPASVRATLDGVRVRAEASGGSLGTTVSGTSQEVRVRLGPEAAADPSTTRPLPATTQEAFRALAVCRGLAAAALVLTAVLDGEASMLLLLFFVVGVVWTAATAEPLLRRAVSRTQHSLLAVADQAFVLALIAVAGEAQDDLAAVQLGIVALYGFVFGPRAAFLQGTAVVLATWALTGSTALLPAGAWAIALAVVLSRGRLAADARGKGLARRSREVVLEGLRAEEEERRALARALHDEVLQLLLSAGQDLEEVGHRPEADADGRRTAHAALEALEQVGGRIVLEPRVGSGDPTRELPALLADLGRRGLPPVHLDVDEELETVHGPVVVVLARELVNNVARHAQARHVGVRLERVGPRTVLEVTDDGVGFAPEQARAALRRGHIGLATVRERVATAGGIVHVASRPGQGTRVRVELPEPAAEPAAAPAPPAPVP